jgi:hypothetical protein
VRPGASWASPGGGRCSCPNSSKVMRPAWDRAGASGCRRHEDMARSTNCSGLGGRPSRWPGAGGRQSPRRRLRPGQPGSPRPHLGPRDGDVLQERGWLLGGASRLPSDLGTPHASAGIMASTEAVALGPRGRRGRNARRHRHEGSMSATGTGTSSRKRMVPPQPGTGRSAAPWVSGSGRAWAGSFAGFGQKLDVRKDVILSPECGRTTRRLLGDASRPRRRQ